MKRLISALLLLSLVIGMDMPAYAQNEEWNTLNSEVELLYLQGRNDQAIMVAKNSLQVAEQTIATSLNDLATLYSAQIGFVSRY
jgi:hypothetical protein